MNFVLTCFNRDVVIVWAYEYFTQDQCTLSCDHNDFIHIIVSLANVFLCV